MKTNKTKKLGLNYENDNDYEQEPLPRPTWKTWKKVRIWQRLQQTRELKYCETPKEWMESSCQDWTQVSERNWWPEHGDWGTWVRMWHKKPTWLKTRLKHPNENQSPKLKRNKTQNPQTWQFNFVTGTIVILLILNTYMNSTKDNSIPLHEMNLTV